MLPAAVDSFRTAYEAFAEIEKAAASGMPSGPAWWLRWALHCRTAF